MQSGCKGGICGHLASAFGNSVSIPIVVLSLLGYCNSYWATVAVIYNKLLSQLSLAMWLALGDDASLIVRVVTVRIVTTRYLGVMCRALREVQVVKPSSILRGPEISLYSTLVLSYE